MIFDILLLIIQISLLSLIVLRESLTRGKKNLIAIIFFVAHLVLVEGQALYVLSDLMTNSEPVFYQSNVITFKSFTYANIVLTISVLIIYVTYYLAMKKDIRPSSTKSTELRESLFSYVVVVGIMLTACCLLIRKLGGLTSFYYSMGVMIGGQVLLIIMLSIGKLPLFAKVASCRKPNPLDWLLFIIAGLLIMLNSRGTAVFLATQYLLLGYFCGPKNKGTGKIFLKLGIVVFLIVIVYGGIRDFVTPRGTFDGLIEYYFRTQGPDGIKALSMWDLFFGYMVGPFAGLSGILNTSTEIGVLHDYGISNLCLFTHLIPYRIRAVLLPDVEMWISSFLAVSGSVVPAGYETSFIHLGLAGIFLFALSLGVFPALFYKKLMSPGADRLKYIILSVQMLNFLLAPAWCIVFWILAELGIIFLYRLILSAGMSFERRGRLEVYAVAEG